MNLFRRFRRFMQGHRIEAEMKEEMHLHLEQRAREHAANGLSPEDARYAALREFGGIEQFKEIAREQRSGFWLTQLAQDLRYASRQLAHRLGFTTITITIIVIGIGATTTVFSVLNSLLLKPLDYDEPGQLVNVFEASGPAKQNLVSPGVFMDWREQATLFEGFAAYSQDSLNFTGNAEPQQIPGCRMSAAGLQLLRAHPILGRIFAPDEDQPGHENVIVLSYELWQSRFGKDEHIIGRKILLNDVPLTVIGVLAPRFLPLESQRFVIPYVLPSSVRQMRDRHWFNVIARLKPGVTTAQAQDELAAVVEHNKSSYPEWKKAWTATVIPMQEQLVQEIKPGLLILFGAVMLVLVVAATNVANLLLARACSRQKEMSLRAALGASRGRIIRQLLAESILLALLGAVGGLLVAILSLNGLQHIFETMNVARARELNIDTHVLVFTLIVSLATGIGFGLAPALQAAGTGLNVGLNDATRGSSTTGGWIRGALIVGQASLALTLLVGAGLLLHSFVRLIDVSPGFRPENILTMQLTLSEQKYPTLAQQMGFYNRIAEQVGALPGVEAAGLNRGLPLAREGWADRFFRVVGRAQQPEEGYDLDNDSCTADYLRAMGIPLLSGRFFSTDDVAKSAPIVIINQTAAHDLFPGKNPLGERLSDGEVSCEIVGVVGDIRTRGLTEKVHPMVYRPGAPSDYWRTGTLYVRTQGSPAAATDLVRRTIQAIDPSQPVANVQTLAAVVDASIADRRLILMMLGAFALVALGLAAIGLYGTMSYAAAQRTREFGIRVALGANPRDLLGLVLGQAFRLVGIGLALGLLSAMSLSRLLVNLLYDVKPTDPSTFLGVSGVLLLVGLLAAWLPARRATRVDPMIALRAE